MEDLNLSVFYMITEINESKTLPKYIHANSNVNVMDKKAIQINGGIMINVDVSVKNAIYIR